MREGRGGEGGEKRVGRRGVKGTGGEGREGMERTTLGTSCRKFLATPLYDYGRMCKL